MKLALVLVLVATMGCEAKRPQGAAPRPQEAAALGGAVAARVESTVIPLELVARVAAASSITPLEAADRLIDDAAAAEIARRRGLDRQLPASWQLEAARGRFASQRFLADARRAGPPTDAEIATLSEVHWAEVDRPPAVRVIHAIVLRPKEPTGIAEAKARAASLLEEVRTAADASTFEARAKAFFEREGLGKGGTVEELPPFTTTGLVLSGGAMDEGFARAAFAIPAENGTSPIVETSFGWHVIRLLERLPEHRMPLEMRRIAFAEEVVSIRAREILTARIGELRAAHPVTIVGAADALMQSAVGMPRE